MINFQDDFLSFFILVDVYPTIWNLVLIEKAFRLAAIPTPIGSKDYDYIDWHDLPPVTIQSQQRIDSVASIVCNYNWEGYYLPKNNLLIYFRFLEIVL
jgi:hypothetical protein